MSRAATGDTVVVKATSNVYTALAAAAFIAVAIGLAVIFMRANSMGWNLLGPG